MSADKSKHPKIDVVMCTYNSNSKLFPTVLRAIRETVPLNRLIVVDKYSQDGTVAEVESTFPDNSIIIQSAANLAYARLMGIRRVSTQWFAFVDDDAILLHNWFECIAPYTRDPRIGAVEGGIITDVSRVNRSTPAQLSPRKKPFIKRHISTVTGSDVVKLGLMNLTRGFTINTLVRTEAARRWAPNPTMGALEDYDLTQQIIGSGWLHIVLDEPLCLHIGSGFNQSLISQWVGWFRKGLWHASNVGFVLLPKDLLILHAVCRIGSNMVAIIKRHDPSRVSDLVWHLALIIGLPIKKYVSPARPPKHGQVLGSNQHSPSSSTGRRDTPAIASEEAKDGSNLGRPSICLLQPHNQALFDGRMR